MKFMNRVRKFGPLLLAAPAALVGSAAHAAAEAAIDVTDVTTGISNQVTSMKSVQLALLGAIVVLVAFGLIKRAIGR